MVMSEQDLKHAQRVLLFMMKSIHEVCVKNDIKYWIDYGSLIGAVRHNGFIPWDDDFDICMLREDYERFDKIAQKELGDDFFWQTYKTDKKWSAFQGKVRLKKTLWMESVLANTGLKENGFFIDIFPIDNVYNAKIIRKIHFALVRLLVRYAFSKLHNNQYFFFRLLPHKITMQIGDYILKICKRSEYVTSFSLGAIKKNLLLKSIFTELVLHQFEEEQFYIPKEYDRRLKLYYGDYMTPPPPEERQGHHGIEAIDFGKY